MDPIQPDPALGGDDTLNPAPENPAKKVWDEFKSQTSVCKEYKRKLLPNWTTNIDYRRGKPFASQTDEDRVNVNLDWSMYKAKEASLFSQIPQVHVDHPPQTQEAGPWLYTFEQRLNDTIVTAGIETAMSEVLPDCINAAGIGALIVAYETLTETVNIPAIDVRAYGAGATTMPDGSPIPMVDVPRITDRRYTVTRISPADLLWPIDFTGADFDNAPWIGRTNRIPWPLAKKVFSLTDADKEKVCGDERTQMDKLTHDIEKDKITGTHLVSYDEIFYKEFHFHEEAKSFYTIRHLVFVNGKEEPVIDEPWKGQRYGEDGTIEGALRYPIRVLTLTYITDETIPPSDSAIGRPQVNEINSARSQMIQQRRYSTPLRWFDVNRVDPTIQQAIMRGRWQGMIPVQGAGNNIIGEVSRASFPQEDFTFDEIAKNDLNEAWQLGPNQRGYFGRSRTSASEANVVQDNFQTRIGRERAKVSKFFVSIAEVLGGLLCLYEDPASFGEGFSPALSKTLGYSILADSTVLVDSNQRLKRLMDFINFAAKSGWVDIGPVLKEIATLSGLDPNVVIKPPQPKPPVEPNISLRLSGGEDLVNPLVFAMLMKSGQAPDPALIEQAKKIILLSAQEILVPGQGDPTSGPAPTQTITPPEPAPPVVGGANPNWGLMPAVGRRSEEG